MAKAWRLHDGDLRVVLLADISFSLVRIAQRDLVDS
jgi:hypothetical protein